MTQSVSLTRCSFHEGAFTCTLQDGHPGDHFGAYSGQAEAAQPQSTDELLAEVFGAALEGKGKRLAFYDLGEDAIPDLTADALDKALVLVRLGEKWDQHGALDLLPELQRSEFFQCVVSDYVTGTREAGEDLSGRSYYMWQMCYRLLSAGYVIGAGNGGVR